jgi:hypothetical protein
MQDGEEPCDVCNILLFAFLPVSILHILPVLFRILLINSDVFVKRFGSVGLDWNVAKGDLATDIQNMPILTYTSNKRNLVSFMRDYLIFISEIMWPVNQNNPILTTVCGLFRYQARFVFIDQVLWYYFNKFHGRRPNSYVLTLHI